jgi:hypothetical protein
MSKPKTVRVQKTEQLDQRKLQRIARRFGIAPISVRELQLGYTEDVPEAAAKQLEEAGFVKRVKTKPRTQQDRVDSLTTQHTEPVETPEGEGEVVTTEPTEGTTVDPEEEEEQS